MPKSHSGIWMSTAFLVALAMAAVVLAARGVGHAGTVTALRLTARWSYCFFLPAYVGGALVATFGPAFRPLAQRGRDLGLAFAAAHLVHLGLVIWDYRISSRPPIGEGSALFFGVAVLFTYLLALFSIPNLAAMLPRKAWWLLRTVGMEYIALAFLSDFLTNPFGHGAVEIIAYLPFAGLGIAAALLRWFNYVKLPLARARTPSRSVARTVAPDPDHGTYERRRPRDL